MILGEVFERFARDSPLSVMAQGVLENAPSPKVVDQLFQDVAERQYTRKLLFSSIVDLMSAVVCRIRPAIRAAYPARSEVIQASLKAVCDKIDRTEPGLSAAPARTTAARLAPAIDEMKGGRPELLPGYHVKILDGNHPAGTEHRLEESRTMRAGALPGRALVVLDPRLMRATEVILCEDGHAQERSRPDQVPEIVRPQDLRIEGRNFSTTSFPFGIARREAFFVVRQHASTPHREFAGERRACGRIDTGRVFEQTIRATDDAGEILILRRVTVALDRPTRDGETELHILTDVPAKDARARTIADLHRRRRTIEAAFAEPEATLDGEIDTPGYPKAALFAFRLALVAYNTLSTVKAALRSVHGEKADDTKISGYDLAEEVAGTHRGMMIAVPKDEWVVFHERSPREMGPFLKQLAGAVRLSEFRKQPRGPKKPRPKRQSGAKIKHVATSQLLEKAKAKPRPDQT
jgi:hypothetical protein